MRLIDNGKYALTTLNGGYYGGKVLRLAIGKIALILVAAFYRGRGQ